MLIVFPLCGELQDTISQTLLIERQSGKPFSEVFTQSVAKH